MIFIRLIIVAAFIISAGYAISAFAGEGGKSASVRELPSLTVNMRQAAYPEPTQVNRESPEMPVRDNR